MRAQVWGCRGSLAAPGADTVGYGGNTSCVEVRLESGHTLVLDAGTGLRALGVDMEHDPRGELHILLTHLHLDHVQGLGFFRPLFNRDVEVHLWGPPSRGHSLADRIARYLSPPLFPVHLADIRCRLVFHDAPDPQVTIGSATVRASNVTHPGPTVGYRIEEHGRVLAYLPDHEPGLVACRDDQPPPEISGHDVAGGADVLFHDAQYGVDEYTRHVGWGHSSVDHAIRFASAVDVGTVVLFHHDPYHTDDQLDRLLADVRRRWDGCGERVCLAREGMTIVIEDGGVRVDA